MQAYVRSGAGILFADLPEDVSPFELEETSEQSIATNLFTSDPSADHGLLVLSSTTFEEPDEESRRGDNKRKSYRQKKAIKAQAIADSEGEIQEAINEAREIARDLGLDADLVDYYVFVTQY